MTEPRWPRFAWQTAELVEARRETETARTLEFAGPRWSRYLPGQHVDVRLTADDGYAAQRSYSIACSGGDRFELTVQRVSGGEVSPYLVDDMLVGDRIEVRGPIGGWFAWHPEGSGPVLLIAGGSGVVPLMAMVRERARVGSRVPFRLVHSVRSPEEAVYADELAARTASSDGLSVRWVYTRFAPEGHGRPPSRLDAADLSDLSWAAHGIPRSYVCGPTGFVEFASRLLVGLGHGPETIRTERFGPTGE